MIPIAIKKHPAFRRGWQAGYNAGRRKTIGTGPHPANVYLFTYRITGDERLKEFIIAESQEIADQCFFKAHPHVAPGEAISIFVDICLFA